MPSATFNGSKCFLRLESRHAVSVYISWTSCESTATVDNIIRSEPFSFQQSSFYIIYSPRPDWCLRVYGRRNLMLNLHVEISSSIETHLTAYFVNISSSLQIFSVFALLYLSLLKLSPNEVIVRWAILTWNTPLKTDFNSGYLTTENVSSVVSF